MRDLAAGTTVRVNLSDTGAAANLESLSPRMASAGTAVAFASRATNLVPGDTNGNWDAFVVELGAASVVYCTAKVNSLGCTPAMASFGVARAGATAGFGVHATQVRNNKPGLLFYSTNGRASAPFQCGTLCVATPIRRTPAVSAGGSPPGFDDCTGIFSIDMAAFASGGIGGSPQPSLQVPGTTVDCQWWGRDQGFAPPCNTTLSDALEYTVAP